MFYYYDGENGLPCPYYNAPCVADKGRCDCQYHAGMQSILSKLVEVDLDEMVTKWDMQGNWFSTAKNMIMSNKYGQFSQFIQQQIKLSNSSQEGKDADR